jgi:hypothetical protein
LARKKNGDSQTRLPQLVVPRSEARERIAERITKGLEIRNIPIRTQEELDAANATKDKWEAITLSCSIEFLTAPQLPRNIDV